MADATVPAHKGGRFLFHDTPASVIFTREDVTSEQRMLADTAAQFLRRDVIPVEAGLFAHDWNLVRALLKKAGALDLLGAEVPEAYGGMALSKVSGALILEQIAVHPSFGASLGVHSAIGMLPLVYFGSEALKAKYLPGLVSGELIGAYALTEPGSGSDSRAAKTTAVLDADGTHYVLNGQKMWITNGGFADLFTIFAKVEGEQFTAFLVERGMGVVSGAEEKKLGLDGSSTTALTLDGVRVPVENVLGRIGEGHKVAFNILNLGRVRLGARNMAAAREALRHAARYAAERRQFGRPIAEFGLIQEKLAEMAIRCFVADAMVFRTLGDVDRALESLARQEPAATLKVIEGFAAECSINKVFTSEALAYITDEAIQVFGGNGYSREFPVEGLYRDARITRIYEGTNEINRLLIATRLLNAGAAGASLPADAAPHGDTALAAERAVLRQVKGLALGLFDRVRAAYGDRVRDQQEVLARLSNIAIEAYAIESALARSEKVGGRGERGALMQSMTRVFVADACQRVFAAARGVGAALGTDGDSLAPALDALQRQPTVDAIPLRRAIAQAVVAAGGPVA